MCASARRRPVLVWIICIYLVALVVVEALGYRTFLLGHLSISDTARLRITSSLYFIWQQSLGALIVSGAVLLWMLSPAAFYLLLAASIISVATDIYTMGVLPTQGWRLGVVIAIWLLHFVIVYYVWVLLRGAVLKGRHATVTPLPTPPTRGMSKWQWALPLLLGSGIVWQLVEYPLKNQSITLDRLRTANELYAREQAVNAEVAPLLPEYVLQRDAVRPDESYFAPEDTVAAGFRRRMAFEALRQRLITLIIQYNHIERGLAKLEQRSPRWFPLRVPPTRITDLKAGPRVGKWMSLTFTAPGEDELVVAVNKDLRRLGVVPRD